MEELFLTSSIEETQETASNLVSSLTEGTTITLTGPMAAGKTTFSQGIGKALGIERVVSPTYMIMREYKIIGHPFLKVLHHLDLYRLNSAEEIKSFDLEEIWTQKDNLVLIEWPESIESLLPNKRIDVALRSTGDSQREITIKYLK